MIKRPLELPFPMCANDLTINCEKKFSKNKYSIPLKFQQPSILKTKKPQCLRDPNAKFSYQNSRVSRISNLPQISIFPKRIPTPTQNTTLIIFTQKGHARFYHRNPRQSEATQFFGLGRFSDCSKVSSYVRDFLFDEGKQK